MTWHILACAACELSHPGRRKLKSSQDLRHTSSDGRPASFVRRRSRRSSTTRINSPCLWAKGRAVSIVRTNGLENTFTISSGSSKPASSSACRAPARLKDQSEKGCDFFGRHCAWRTRYSVIRLRSPNVRPEWRGAERVKMLTGAAIPRPLQAVRKLPLLASYLNPLTVQGATVQLRDAEAGLCTVGCKLNGRIDISSSLGSKGVPSPMSLD